MYFVSDGGNSRIHQHGALCDLVLPPGNPLVSPKALHQAPDQESRVPTDSWQLHHRAQSLPSPISLPSPPKICPVPTTQSGTRTASKSPVSRQLQYPPPSINLLRPGIVPPSHLALVQALLGCYRGQGRDQQPPAMAACACTDTYGLAGLPLVQKAMVGRRTARIDAGRVRVHDAHTCCLPDSGRICSSSLDSDYTATTDRTGTLPARQ
ncbi:hypothetical protein GGI43DRAFT_174230 [Trichoderma evansii]